MLPSCVSSDVQEWCKLRYIGMSSHMAPKESWSSSKLLQRRKMKVDVTHECVKFEGSAARCLRWSPR